jgi:hypothetical protein
MASMQRKAFSALEFSKTSSVIMVQRAFRRRYGIDPPLAKNVRRWYEQFKEKNTAGSIYNCTAKDVDVTTWSRRASTVVNGTLLEQ